MSICKYEKSATEEKVEGGGGGISKTFDQNWADALATSDKGSYFEQEKLFALDEEDV